MLSSCVNRVKRIFSKKYREKECRVKTSSILHTHNSTKWNGGRLAMNTGLSSRDAKWLQIYANNATDPNKKGYWRIAQKKIAHLFTDEQLLYHTQFNTSSKGTGIDILEWKKMLAHHCMANNVLSPSIYKYLKTEVDILVNGVESTESIPGYMVRVDTASATETDSSVTYVPWKLEM